MGLFKNMQAKPKRSMHENESGGDESGLASIIGNGEDLAVTVRHAFDAGKPETLLYQLKNIARSKEVEIEDLCKVHYEDFIVAVDEFSGVLLDAEEMKRTLSSENSRLQEVGSYLLLKLDEILECHSIKKNTTEAIQLLKICLQVTNMCKKCNQYLLDNHFYPALNALDLIERDYLHHIPAKNLQRVIKKQIPAIRLYIKEKVCRELDDWLANTRSLEMEIGQLAIAQAASTHERDKEKHNRQRDLEETHLVSTDCVFSLDIDEIDEDPALKLDLSLVYRAFHILSRLGNQDFHDYYCKSRLLQLNSALEMSPRQSFLEFHQMFFYQIAGYFLVECRVFQALKWLFSASQVENMWKTALEKVALVLEEKFSGIEALDHLLLIKHNITLLVATLERYGFEAAALLNVLDKNRDRYHELLFEDCRKRITDVLANDTYEQMVVKNEDEYKMNVLSFDLQVSDLIPVFPYIAPFSSTVPEVCRIVQSFIVGSVSYMSYCDVKDCSDNAIKYLDKLLIYVVSEALLKGIHSSTTGASQAMQIAANITVLERACDLFLRLVVRLCGIPVRSSERLHGSLTAIAVLKTSEDAAYHALLKLVNSKVSEIMSLGDNIDWTATDVPENGNDYVNVLTWYLDNVVSTAQQILPLEPVYALGSGVLRHISDSFVAVLLNDGVKRFNANTIMSISNDLKQLESLSDERFPSLVLDELQKETSLSDCLLEARQLVNLVLSRQPEKFMDPAIREELYSLLDFDKVASVLEKLKDLPDKNSGGLSGKSTKQHAGKKSIDILKRLRDFN